MGKLILPASASRWVCRLAFPLSLSIGPAWAEPVSVSEAVAQTTSGPLEAGKVTVTARGGNHPGFGRLVFDVSGDTRYRFSRDGDHVHLDFFPAVSIGDPRFLPRNVQSVSGGNGDVDIVVAPGARVRPSRIGERVVVDVLDRGGKPDVTQEATPAVGLPLPPIPPADEQSPSLAEAPARTAPGPAAPATAPPKTVEATPAAEPEPPVQETAKPQPTPPAVAAPEPPAPATTGPIATVAARVTPGPAGGGSAFSVPFGADIGAAALRRGDLALLVFDQRRPVDLAALRADPIFATASVQLLPSATLIRMRLPAGMGVALQRPSSDAWTIAIIPDPPVLRPIRPVTTSEDMAFAGRIRLLLPGSAPGEIVSLADPDTGAILLLGTQRQPGQGIAVAHRTPRYIVLPTWQGVAVQPLADSLSLRSVKEGFVLAGADLPPFRAASAEAEGQEAAAGLTRRFNFPVMAPTALQSRPQEEVADAAVAPARARGRKRLAVAKTMIAQGLAVEAQAVLQLAGEDDPVVAASADAAGLGAAAALLADRIDDSSAIEDPRLSGSDEVALWRAVRASRLQDGSPQAAAVFAATLPLAAAYPAGLRDRLLPLAIETMIAGGEAAAAAPALAREKDNPTLALARAMKLQSDGNTDAALAAYAAVTQGPDRRQGALAASRAVELALASGRMDVSAAADALDRQLYGWRGDRHELALRKRVAELRASAGAWRPALALLRETLDVFPDWKAEIRAEMLTILSSLLRATSVDALAPLDLITLLGDNADLLAELQKPSASEASVPEGALQAQLADKLLALDLPGRAAPQLERLMQAVPQGAGRAGFGASLAALKLREGDARGALETLVASDPAAAADMPASLVEQRALLFATASARVGDRGRALAALAMIRTAAAGELRSTILEQAGDWPAATEALADQAESLLPADGSLNDSQRRLLIRLASAASQAGDQAMLERLRTRESPRMANGPLGDMFRLLTADRVQSASDLKRAGQEMALARTVPDGIKALAAPSSTPIAAR